MHNKQYLNFFQEKTHIEQKLYDYRQREQDLTEQLEVLGISAENNDRFIESAYSDIQPSVLPRNLSSGKFQMDLFSSDSYNAGDQHVPYVGDITSPSRIAPPNSNPSHSCNHAAQQACQPGDGYLVSYPPASALTLSASHGPHVHISSAPHSALRAPVHSMPATASALVPDSRCSSISNVSTASNTSLNSAPLLRRTIRANLPDHQRTIVRDSPFILVCMYSTLRTSILYNLL